ncbi:dnaJ-like subfamily A member 2 [Histomonas meleagridis]|uniref:dnaJ-like subfamily A member 2 n=1 Tax=Histomonas meleagridis TaxID=135588 RepID=UPI003559A0A7|nr:dnaJ-like subfamily A member 2 [Histomonas meleagridis]
MVVDTRLYDILGVSPDASQRQIKRAFQQKARELHPDKNHDDPSSTEQFQEINEAYEILKDPKKRRSYDQFGLQGVDFDFGNNDNDLFDIFTKHFGFSSFDDVHNYSHIRRSEDITYPVQVSLEDLYNGRTIKLRIKRQRICSKCHGNGTKDGRYRRKCPVCQGKGSTVRAHRQGSAATREINTCSKCNGSGEVIEARDVCTECNGECTVETAKYIKVDIKRGMENGETIIFKGESDEAPNVESRRFGCCR